jgi:hypothetical protein
VEDYDYCFRAAVQGLHFAYLEEKDTHILMRHHPQSFSKNLLHMYKQELELRQSMKAFLQQMGKDRLIKLNDSRYQWRLRRLHDLLIDQVRKGRRELAGPRELKWQFNHSNLRQKIYFFPRIIKAVISGHFYRQS